MKYNLFLAHTPYNLLLSIGVAATQHADDHNEVIVLSNFHDAQYLLDAFTRAAPHLFECIHVIPYIWSDDSDDSRKKARIAALNAVKPLVDNKKWDTLYACSTQLPFNHALWRSARRGKQPRRIFLEEGFSCYLNEHGKLPSRLEIQLKKIRYGGGWVEPFQLGYHPNIDEAWLHFPALANDWIKRTPCRVLPASVLVNDTMRRCAEELMHNQPWYNPSKSLLAVVVLEKLPFLKNPARYKDNYRELINLLQKEGLQVALKYHPRDRSGQYLGEFENCLTLPPGLPVEIFLTYERSRLDCVVGEFTTALATARIVAQKAAVISLQCSNRKKPQLDNIYRTIGVPIAAHAADVGVLLSKINRDEKSVMEFNNV